MLRDGVGTSSGECVVDRFLDCHQRGDRAGLAELGRAAPPALVELINGAEAEADGDYLRAEASFDRALTGAGPVGDLGHAALVLRAVQRLRQGRMADTLKDLNGASSADNRLSVQVVALSALAMHGLGNARLANQQLQAAYRHLITGHRFGLGWLTLAVEQLPRASVSGCLALDFVTRLRADGHPLTAELPVLGPHMARHAGHNGQTGQAGATLLGDLVAYEAAAGTAVRAAQEWMTAIIVGDHYGLVDRAHLLLDGGADYLAAQAFDDAARAARTEADRSRWSRRADTIRRGFADDMTDDLAGSALAPELSALLTPAQRSVVVAVSQGLTNKETASRLNCSTRTVEAHLTAVFRKLGLRRRTQLATVALQLADADALGQPAKA